MNLCHMSERRRKLLKCVLCDDDTLEEIVLDRICMKYPFLLSPGFIRATPHLLRELCTRQYLYKTECNGRERLIYAISHFQYTEDFAARYTVQERITAAQTVISS